MANKKQLSKPFSLNALLSKGAINHLLMLELATYLGLSIFTDMYTKSILKTF